MLAKILDSRPTCNCVITSAEVSIINTMKYFLTNWVSAKIHTHQENAASLGDYLNHTPLRECMSIIKVKITCNRCPSWNKMKYMK